MNITEKQRAYYLRKMKTRFARHDINNDGYISREDYELMANKFAEFASLNKEQATSMRIAFRNVADHALGLKPGVKVCLAEAAERTADAVLSLPPEKQKELFTKEQNAIFDAIDLDKDGEVSQSEFQIYFKVFASGVSEEHANRSFDIIDDDKNGKISREEFLTAAMEFLTGVNESEFSEVFFGPLI